MFQILFQPWCRLITTIYNYFVVTNFFWMFVEGCYLHTAIVMTYSTDKLRKWVFLFIGWCEYSPVDHCVLRSTPCFTLTVFLKGEVFTFMHCVAQATKSNFSHSLTRLDCKLVSIVGNSSWQNNFISRSVIQELSVTRSMVSFFSVVMEVEIYSLLSNSPSFPWKLHHKVHSMSVLDLLIMSRDNVNVLT